MEQDQAKPPINTAQNAPFERPTGGVTTQCPRRGVSMNDETDNHAAESNFHPVALPCLLWEPTLDAVILATEMGTGTVLKAGSSVVLKVGMVVPYAANRWCFGGEEWDFILPPPDMEMKLKNLYGHLHRPKCLEVKVKIGTGEEFR
jgi:hypothetical protein